MTVKGGTSQACAACKYQRRRCTPDCALAPYFPADKPKMFQNAHRLFGVCNIMKILKVLRDDQKEEAMKSIIYEADMRQRFPVFGCSLVIWQLKEQLRQCQDELFYVNNLLAVFRNNRDHGDDDPMAGAPISSLSPNSQFQLGLDQVNDMGMSPNNYYVANNNTPSPDDDSNHHQIHQFYDTNNEMGLVSNEVFLGDHKNNSDNVGYVLQSNDNNVGMVKPLWVQQNENNVTNNNSYYYGKNVVSSYNNNNSSSFGMKMPQYHVPQTMPPVQHEIEVDHDYDDMPFDGTIDDDRQSYIESKLDACESSAESPFKGTMQSIDVMSQKHELKSAAACFSLTSVNE